MTDTGRPTTYTDEIALSICTLICSRDEDTGEFFSLRAVSRRLEIPERTIYQWLNANPQFAQMYTRAREDRAHLLADEVIRIADTESDPQKAKVRIDARKWWAGKVNRQYADRTVVAGDPDNPQKHEHTHKSEHLDELTRRLTQGATRVGTGGEAGGSER